MGKREMPMRRVMGQYGIEHQKLDLLDFRMAVHDVEAYSKIGTRIERYYRTTGCLEHGKPPMARPPPPPPPLEIVLYYMKTSI